MNAKASGLEPGQRQLNGLQTTGREYRSLKDFSGSRKSPAGLTLTDNSCYPGEWLRIRRIEVTVTVIWFLELARRR